MNIRLDAERGVFDTFQCAKKSFFESSVLSNLEGGLERLASSAGDCAMNAVCASTKRLGLQKCGRHL